MSWDRASRASRKKRGGACRELLGIFFFPMIGREVFKVEMFVLINLLLEKCFLYHKVFWTKGTGKAGFGAGV